MLRQRPTIKKPQTVSKKRRNSDLDQNNENIRPSIPFNTKGYFSPEQPFNEDYLKAKLQVFKKYRQDNQQLILLQRNNIHRGLFIQKGLPNLSTNNPTPPPFQSSNNQKVYNTFIKNYMNRKQKKQRLSQLKFTKNINLNNNVLSQIGNSRDYQSCYSSRTSKRASISSRQSTIRFNLYNQETQ